MSTNHKVSIVIPAYNEESRIINTIESHIKYFTKKIDFEIIIVVNNTTDKTLELLVEKYRRENHEKRVRIYNINKRIGKGGAVVFGLSKADNATIGFVDADLSLSSRQVFKLITTTIWDQNTVAIASRSHPDSSVKNKSRRRVVASKGFNRGVNLLFRLGVGDTQCGGKFFPKSLFDQIVNNLSVSNMTFDVDLLNQFKKHKANIEEVPVAWIDDKNSSISNPIKTSVEMAVAVFELRISKSKLISWMFWPLTTIFEKLFYTSDSLEYKKLDLNKIKLIAKEY